MPFSCGITPLMAAWKESTQVNAVLLQLFILLIVSTRISSLDDAFENWKCKTNNLVSLYALFHHSRPA